MLRDITARIEPHEVIGVIGPSGSGKSTLVQLLLGLRDPTDGVVRADGRDIRTLSRSEWARRVTFVPQQAHLIAGTVADNIRFLRDDVDDERIVEASKLANLHDDVMGWSEGYDRQVGEQGSHLSGGQQQRLIIARALVERPDVIILDEPTSALDVASEYLIRQTLDGLRTESTVIIIAHRLSTLDVCDRIMVIMDGELRGFDSPDRLEQTQRLLPRCARDVRRPLTTGSYPLMKIALCALTFHRPVGLRRLLEGLDALERPDSAEVVVLIVDNDPAESGRPIVEAVRTSTTIDIEYLVEPTRGIWAGRNTAVAHALSPGCRLRVLHRRRRVARARLVGATPRNTIRHGRRRRHRAGASGVRRRRPHSGSSTAASSIGRRSNTTSEITWATTSQVLLDRRVFDDRPTPFDARFGLSGGDDTHFFAELHEAGYSMHWCDRAIVHESIPVSRVDERWLLKRQYRRGQTLSLSLRILDPRASRYVRRLGKAAIEAASGLGIVVTSAWRGRAVLVQGLERLAFSAGLVTGLAGRRYDEYTQTHGS